ncbi:hypothetical protein NQD34_009967 [Periophthalmus magnuspinnatus]|uniref:dehydrogenase/reductase SDR family member 13-like n=1 Tax=Periophthalmus magnuspinnatus TaxID=409849 RepID=UPI00145B0949|nr:dehydrogenase/reductase SDR family member 13-like [Periophthalmus magnuspinnatus]KAJ0022477.1 hypothetical protein NQD34_009967 [Periophthalmus magnuspinnatus]
MSCFLICGAVFVVAAYFYHEIIVKGKRCTSTVKLHGKTVIITGSNTGIGKRTAVDLAKRGARVIMACRSRERGEAAMLDVKTESGSSDVVFMPLDLASLKSVRSFAENFLKSESRLDILINNAGLLCEGRTDDGFGMMFGVNHLGHFLLTNLLLPRLKESAPSRVVTVSSVAHNFGHIDFDCLNKHKTLGLGSTMNKYSASKLCNVLFTHELNKRLQGTNVSCFSLHPGAISSEFDRNVNRTLVMLITPLSLFFFKTPEQGCQTTLHCALQPGLEPLSGRYFSNCTVRNLFAKARDDAAAKKLWELSESMSGLQ